MSNTNDKKLLVGKIGALFGVHGWVKIISYTDPKINIIKYKPWHIKVDNVWKKIEINEGRKHGKNIIIQIKKITNIDSAKHFVGTDIYINKSQLPELKDEKHYWDDLIGLDVVNKENITLGKVMYLIDTGANHVLVVSGKKQHLIAYTKPFLISVDLKTKKILVDWDENF